MKNAWYLFLRPDFNISMHTSTAGTVKIKWQMKSNKRIIRKQKRFPGKTHITVSYNSYPRWPAEDGTRYTVKWPELPCPPACIHRKTMACDSYSASVCGRFQGANNLVPLDCLAVIPQSGPFCFPLGNFVAGRVYPAQEAIECRIASEILGFVPFCLIKVPEYLERDTSPRGGRGIQGSDSKRRYLKKETYSLNLPM